MSAFDFKSMWRHGSTYCLLAILFFLGAAPEILGWIAQNLPALIPNLPRHWQSGAALGASLAGLVCKALVQAEIRRYLDRFKAWLKRLADAGRDVGGAVRKNLAVSAAVLAVLTSAVGLAAPELQRDEGRELQTYADMAGVLTACYGHTGPDVVRGRVYTAQECSDLLDDDAFQHAYNVYRCAPGLINDVHALAAWARFDFNTGAFCSAKYATMITARRLIAAGRIKASCAQMDPWVYVAGRKVRGQVLRRARERAMCEAS